MDLHVNACVKCGDITANGNYCQECGPAPKEESMDGAYQCTKCGNWYRDCTCPGSSRAEREAKIAKPATLRAVYDRAFDAAMAAMPRVGMESDCNITQLVLEADMYAIAAVRTHATRMAELEKVIEGLEVAE